MRRPRLGFLGLGWIGRHRLQAIVGGGRADVAALAEPAADRLAAALELAPDAVVCRDLEAMLEQPLDGIVIATPSALHADQSVAALRRGLAVFCQKPLARTAAEARRVVAAARDADRLVGVDLSYRHTAAMRAVRGLVAGGELGTIHAVDLVFHNAYGPDQPWFYDRTLAGGGCLVDLGTHLIDLALWTLDFPAVRWVQALLSASGALLTATSTAVEDFASAQLELDGGIIVRLACSWRLPAGRDAVIGAAFYGSAGGAALRNLGGSFYDFQAERYRGTARDVIASPPDDWGGRAISAWADAVAAGGRYDAGCERVVEVAAILDAMYRDGRRA
jgi:predicted dehydrogenase